jgi:adenosylcobinamide-GDP ribazoletransferase
MRVVMRGLWVALGFLTRLPLPSHRFDPSAAAARESLAWYPVVGLLLGALLWSAASLLHATPAPLAAGLLLAGWVALTGALHLDGLADSADAWVGGLGDRERTLTIMKDPRCGPAGVVALVLVLLLKFAALLSLAPSHGLALLLAPLLARGALVLLLLTTPYARSSGLGSALLDAPRRACWCGLALSAVLAVVCGGPGLRALVASLLVFVLWRRAGLRRIGGFTGDTAGALAELIELTVLLAVAL